MLKSNSSQSIRARSQRLCLSVLRKPYPMFQVAVTALATVGLMTTTGCSLLPNREAQAQSQAPNGEREGAVSIETAVAETGSLDELLSYTGTTEPVRSVSLRSQAEGRLLNLSVDVGDPVNEGEVLGQLDDRLLTILLNQTESELAALESEVARAEAEVSDAQAQVEEAQVQLEQAQADADRFQRLLNEGAITEQEAEQAQTAVRSAEQVLQSAEERVRTRQQSVVAAQRRVSAQESAVSEGLERRDYSSLVSPIAGVVLERVSEPGNLVLPGDEVLKLGDFSQVKVVVQVSELERAEVRSGQIVQVQLDAFPNQEFRGQVTRISPAADPTARLIPVEITLPNPGGQLGSGLLARVQFQSDQATRIVVPESALRAAGDDPRPTGGNRDSTLFVLEQNGDETLAIARSVQVGDRSNGRVEIRSGLEPGETYIVRSARSLEDGQPVRISILSESAQ
ncbi:efflux transporter periplasmic adaptor subunit [filamentous cyanobacterium CCP2]|nr:efflux transporter periplasmic adaptor subunit [filamentous cyanobacterium CCP2]